MTGAVQWSNKQNKASEGTLEPRAHSNQRRLGEGAERGKGVRHRGRWFRFGIVTGDTYHSCDGGLETSRRMEWASGVSRCTLSVRVKGKVCDLLSESCQIVKRVLTHRCRTGWEGFSGHQGVPVSNVGGGFGPPEREKIKDPVTGSRGLHVLHLICTPPQGPNFLDHYLI